MGRGPKDIGFEVVDEDPSGARRVRFATEHGSVEGPTFMPVGTQGAVKAVLPRDVRADVLLANTYHLSLGDRTELVERAGGLHRFMNWGRTILTDSGGFQVFSLPGKEVTDDGVSFPSERGGQRYFLDAEASMDIQRRLGADIVMAFDECTDHDAPKRYVERSVDRTARWAERCRKATLADHQLLFGIVQGAVHDDLRERSVAQIADIPFDGFAIGGVSVGEGYAWMTRIVSFTAPRMPRDRPRYLMGVGLPEDLLSAIRHGMDMFDCVIPTRYARGGTLFTRDGKLRITDRRLVQDERPIDAECSCYACQNYPRMVLRHLHYAREPLYDTLASIHNLHFYRDLMLDARAAISAHEYDAFHKRWLARYGAEPEIYERAVQGVDAPLPPLEPRRPPSTDDVSTGRRGKPKPKSKSKRSRRAR